MRLLDGWSSVLTNAWRKQYLLVCVDSYTEVYEFMLRGRNMYRCWSSLLYKPPILWTGVDYFTYSIGHTNNKLWGKIFCGD